MKSLWIGKQNIQITEYNFYKIFSAICLLQMKTQNLPLHVSRFHGLDNFQDLCEIFTDEVTLQAYKEENGFTDTPGRSPA